MNTVQAAGAGLTLKSVVVRAVSLPMRRPIVSKVGIYPEWPFILIDVKTKEGIVGRAYLEPYLKSAVGYIGGAILDLAERLKGKTLAPLDCYRDAVGALHLIGRQGVSLIATAGLDMAIWDAMAQGQQAAARRIARRNDRRRSRLQHQWSVADSVGTRRRRGGSPGRREWIQGHQTAPGPAT